TGIVINGQVRGGRGVHIEHQVTIGAEKRQSPTIGDGVFIGAGAKIIGQVSIGTGARVGANAVVCHDVPDHATVVGIPAKVIRIREPEKLLDQEDNLEASASECDRQLTTSGTNSTLT